MVVWAIGDNSVATEKRVTELVEAVSSDKRVILMTVRVPKALQDINYELFWEMAEKYDNVTVCDWYSASAGHSEFFWDDGTRLRPEGVVAYMKLLVQTINGFQEKTDNMGKFVLAYLVIMNVVAFALYAIDKRRAVQGAWRIPEKTLLLAAFVGGALGSLLAMRLVHHKTRKWYFAYGVPAFLALHVVLLAFAASLGLI